MFRGGVRPSAYQSPRNGFVTWPSGVHRPTPEDGLDPHSARMTDAAERLGLHRSNLYRKMRQLEMPVDET